MYLGIETETVEYKKTTGELKEACVSIDRHEAYRAPHESIGFVNTAKMQAPLNYGGDLPIF